MIQLGAIAPAAQSLSGADTIERLVPAGSGWSAGTRPWHGRPRLWHERMLELAYRLFTPTFEVPWLENFGQVNVTLWRGAQPGHVALKLLKAMGVDTIINLRSESTAEEPRVRALGLGYLYLPMDPIAAPNHTQTLAFLHAVTDPAHGRVFFHCYHGADRTGLLAACYRLAHDGWSLEATLAELDAFRFHHMFQQPKLTYIKAFASYWSALPLIERNRILHRA